MATEPFDRVAYNQGERPLTTDQNQAASDIQRSNMTLADYILRASASLATGVSTPLNNGAFSAFLADSFSVVASSPTANLFVNVTPGLGFANLPSAEPTNIGGLSGCDDVSPLKPLPLSTLQTFAVPTPNASNPRWDIIEVAYDLRLEQPQSRDILNPTAGTVTPTSVDKVLAYYLDGQVGTVVSPSPSTTGIGYKQGVAGSSPAVPGNTTGYITVAAIYVPANATQIAQADIVDLRPLCFPGSLSAVVGTLSLVTDGTNATSLSGQIQCPPGVKAAAWCHANLLSNGVNIAIVAGGGEAACQFQAFFPLAAATAGSVSASPVWSEILAASASLTVNLQVGNTNQNAWAAPFAGEFTGFTVYDGGTNYTGPHTFKVLLNGAAPSSQPSVVLNSGVNAAAVHDNVHFFSFSQGDLITVTDTGGSAATAQANAPTASAEIIYPGSTSYPLSGVKATSVSAAGLGAVDAGDMQAIGVSPVGVPSGGVQVYGASANGQPAFKVNLPLSLAAGTYAIQFIAFLSAGAAD